MILKNRPSHFVFILPYDKSSLLTKPLNLFAKFSIESKAPIKVFFSQNLIHKLFENHIFEINYHIFERFSERSISTVI